jgi:hypothetical protein
MLRSEDYTEQDWAQLGRMFTNEFKPALQKWCSAYRGHISIRPEDLKLENFRGQLGVRTSPLQTISYSFVVGDTTITFGERDGNAFVFQMMTGQAAKDTSSPPPPGTVPNLNVPVTRDEVMAMEVADTGNQFPPNQVYIWPTGSGSAIQGGARVDFGGHDNPIYYNFSGSNVSYIFGPGGSIINYERDGPPPSGYMTNHPPLSTW